MTFEARGSGPFFVVSCGRKRGKTPGLEAFATTRKEAETPAKRNAPDEGRSSITVRPLRKNGRYYYRFEGVTRKDVAAPDLNSMKIEQPINITELWHRLTKSRNGCSV